MFRISNYIFWLNLFHKFIDIAMGIPTNKGYGKNISVLIPLWQAGQRIKNLYFNISYLDKQLFE
jgi:hypothetical protein